MEKQIARLLILSDTFTVWAKVAAEYLLRLALVSRWVMIWRFDINHLRGRLNSSRNEIDDGVYILRLATSNVISWVSKLNQTNYKCFSGDTNLNCRSKASMADRAANVEPCLSDDHFYKSKRVLPNSLATSTLTWPPNSNTKQNNYLTFLVSVEAPNRNKQTK